MHCGKGFTKGLITGAFVGGVIGMMADPIKDKQNDKMRKSAGSIIRSVGNIVDGFVEMRG